MIDKPGGEYVFFGLIPEMPGRNLLFWPNFGHGMDYDTLLLAEENFGPTAVYSQ